MKVSFLILPIFLLFADPQTGNKEIDFALYFGNDFVDDTVTIEVNGSLIAENIELKPRMNSPLNLVIEQSDNLIHVRPYYGPNKEFKCVKLTNSILRLKTLLNGKSTSFDLDLRKGKYLYAKYKFVKAPERQLKELIITQENSGPIIL